MTALTDEIQNHWEPGDADRMLDTIDALRERLAAVEEVIEAARDIDKIVMRGAMLIRGGSFERFHAALDALAPKEKQP